MRNHIKYIYLIRNNINGKIYIGQTKNTKSRFHAHINDKRADSLVYRAIQKYGKENFTFEVIVCCLDFLVADELEKYYISYYNSNNRKFGYNIENGGSFSKEKTLETRKKISESKKGSIISKEHAIKLSLALKNKPKTKEHVEKVALANTGKIRSKEFCIEHKKRKQKDAGIKVKLTNIVTREEIIFPAIHEAARFLSYSYQRVRQSLVNCYIMNKQWKVDYVY